MNRLDLGKEKRNQREHEWKLVHKMISERNNDGVNEQTWTHKVHTNKRKATEGKNHRTQPTFHLHAKLNSVSSQDSKCLPLDTNAL